MDANMVLGKLKSVNQTFDDTYPKPTTEYLLSCGWRQIDGNGMFFLSQLNDNNYGVDMNTPNKPHVTLRHDHQKIDNLDGAGESDLIYINEMLEELEIWLAL